MLSIFLLNITPAGQGTGQCPANCCPIIRSLPISSVLISFAVPNNYCPPKQSACGPPYPLRDTDLSPVPTSPVPNNI